MKLRFHYRSCLLLSVIFAVVEVGFGQDVPATAAFRILDTASHLANEGRLKDALAIVNFVQASPGLTDREHAECQVLLAGFEALAIKFYASKSLGRDAPVLSGRARVSAIRSGAGMVIENNEPSPAPADEGLTDVDQAIADHTEVGFVEADRTQLKTFEWRALAKGGSRLAGGRENRVAELPDWPAGEEVPHMLTPDSVLRSVFDEAEPAPSTQGHFPDDLHVSSDPQVITSVERRLARVGTDATPPTLPFPGRAMASADSLVKPQSVDSCRGGQPTVIRGESIFELRWVVLITGIVLGSLPAVVIRIVLKVRNRLCSKTLGIVREGGCLPDGGSRSVANVDSILSQIVKQNQLLQRTMNPENWTRK